MQAGRLMRNVVAVTARAVGAPRRSCLRRSRERGHGV
jgi:hypothetical protein